MFRYTAIGELLRSDPGRARAEICEAIAEARGNVARAAIVLGTSRKHLYRILERLELAREVDACRERRRREVRAERAAARAEARAAARAPEPLIARAIALLGGGAA